MATYNMDRAANPQSSGPISRSGAPIVDVICQFQKLCTLPSSAMEATDGVPEENNADWILDSLVAYLQGPVWITPILNFVEQKSVVFEGDGAELEDEYRGIHKDFRNLVDVMLGAYMDDLGLQPEHLESALSQIQPSVRSAALQQLLEPVQSAGDYDRFKVLMRAKNEQLHNEAVEMLRRKRDHPGHPSIDSQNASNDEFSEEDINEAIRQSMAEHVAERNAQVAERRDVDRALAASVAGLLKSQTTDEVAGPLAEAAPVTNVQTPTRVATKVPDPEDVERRRVLLRAQRDKILSQKRKERELQLHQQELSDREAGNKVAFGTSRPRSGRAARAALAGEASPEVDERTIQYRRLLLQKIKEEVEGTSK
ncbi:cilia- and flagella-associated protein 36-like [Daphnia carinata]|uniref:cilia- and flagella-associated protein 36-like n=1 Tax=Daphnia carinata TaxID=120202 RepID=UPI002868B19A|nr:cilia- and flagella-associated protein 36-like [Daphnia carinata]